ncbi:MAG: exodeoxyribonuclease V subunit gamma, partial [Myxococcales bacterium]|nr:exodeoxyribonuclease V subunit gamma [Myxococcales bacterium]
TPRPAERSVLHRLQSDLLYLHRRGLREGALAPVPFDPDDASLRVHDCHSPMREVEVLRDQLLAAMDEDPTLTPDQILVMTPRIETYAPVIDAVFGATPIGSPAGIAYRIADRVHPERSSAIGCLLGLLDLLPSRMHAPALLDRLEPEFVHAHFGLEAADLEVIEAHLRACGVSWGIDAEHKRELGLPPLEEGTWRFAFRRILLGYAMPMQGQGLYGGVLPHDEIEADLARIFGAFIDFCERLFEARARLLTPRPAAQWCEDLSAFAAQMLRSDEATGPEHRRLREALEGLAAEIEAAGFEEAIDLRTIRDTLEARLSASGSTAAFLSGGITFCQLVPMRSIPFRIVALIGMSYDDFPRAEPSIGFDRLFEEPRAGDRSLRGDDRLLFLEALLAARDRLLITYVGRSIRDGSVRSPSVVVGELLDTLGDMLALPEGLAPVEREAHHALIRERLVLRHPLQSFSPRYFGADADPRLFSYSMAALRGAQASFAEPEAPRPFLEQPLEALGDPQQSLSLSRLSRFIGRPIDRFVAERLGLREEREEEPLSEWEPLELDHLSRWALGEALIERLLRAEPPELAYARIRASGKLPPGQLGRIAFQKVLPQCAEIARLHAPFASVEPLAPLPFRYETEAGVVQDAIRGLRPAGLGVCTFSTLRPKRLLRAWVPHLALQLAAPPGIEPLTTLLGRDADGVEEIRLGAVEAPAERLGELVSLFRLGMRLPIPFIPEASWAYAARFVETGSESEAQREAIRLLEGSSFAGIPSTFEGHPRRVFGSVDALFEPRDGVPSFHELALMICAPILGLIGADA